MKPYLNGKMTCEIGDTVGQNEAYTEIEIKTYVNQKQTLLIDGQTRFIIFKLITNDIVGCLDLFNYDSNKEQASIGILIDEAYRTANFGYEALMAIEKNCKEALGLKILNCVVLEDNSASIALFEKAGYTMIRLEKDNYVYQDKTYSQLIYQKSLK